ncbi:cytochrome P450 3A13 [Sodiomyces alkalinus F11]|uniref:Cytochrome P450 3A13 n=1 Tax=Sodiomyces alkalinus (strain CBS 110278 / VKM F-3762 / F11) TaxID=1314773 RepID=A0A3N2PNE4_SODAK|nr:cytochrome P450 3A13 [Sodiomyces alkalinus F11]ROT35954.1 cytochrome P450 3A13 [Sodiomyces alkalinus F11]
MILFLSFQQCAAWFVVLALIYLGLCLASPLRKVPGPWYTGFTVLILRWHELRANRTRYVHSLHAKYGPVVRLGPAEVSFTSYEAIKEIYCSRGSGYDKSEFYDLFRVFGRRTMFSTLYKEEHAKRKRVFADRYANSNIMKPASLGGIQERSRRFIQCCEASGTGSHDIFMSLHAYACDCATYHLFDPYGTNCLQDEADMEMMSQITGDDSLQNRLIQHYSPTLHRMLSGIVDLFAEPRATPLADNFAMAAARGPEPSPFTLLSRMQEKSAAGSHLDQLDMAAEVMDHMVAGIDTTGDGLCFLMWELSQPRSFSFQEELQRELRAQCVADDAHTGFDNLPFLDAVVQEGLRCFPPIPMSLPRRVPADGRTIDGYDIPGSTVVSCQPFSVHRVHDVFPDPDTFNPERWCEAEGDAERKRVMFAFSNGGRGCVGKHLALVEMKTLLRDVYSRYTTLPCDTMTAESMAMDDHLISSRPLGKKCLLRFIPLSEKHE